MGLCCTWKIRHLSGNKNKPVFEASREERKPALNNSKFSLTFSSPYKSQKFAHFCFFQVLLNEIIDHQTKNKPKLEIKCTQTPKLSHF